MNNLTNINKSDKRFNNAAKAVRNVIGAMSSGTQFNGWKLKELCVQIYPELVNMYTETFLREMREYCHDQYILVSRKESLYEKVGDPIISEIKRPELKKYANLKQQELF